SPASYTAGYIDVYRNGVKLGSADFTATNGTTVVLANACAAGDYVRFEGFLITTFNNAVPNTNGAVGDSLIASLSASKLTGSRTIPAASMPAGSVIQVVSTAKTDVFSTSSSTFVDLTGMSVSITPSSASSKIMVFCNMPIVGTDSSSGAGFALNRNGSLLNQGTGGTTQNAIAVCYWGAVNNVYGGTSFSYLDSPSTTSALTYKIQMLASSGTTVYINRRVSDTYFGASSTITVMEIAA
ncbi:MAG: hypothetical protein ACOVLB_01740, partial [Candidatus Nanopelagicus sp.]